MGRRYGTLTGYLAREFIFAFFVSFLFFFVIFFVNQLLVMAENILAKRVPLWDVARLVFYAFPSIIAMSFPFAALVGALMSVGRLSGDSEIMVMMASGVPKRRVFAPFLVLGFAISVVSFGVNDILLPLGTINYGKLYRKLLQSTPALELQPYTVKRYEGLTIVTGAGDGDILTDVTIMDRVDGAKKRVITASRAFIADAELGTGILSLELERVFIHVYDPGNPERHEYMSASRMIYNILLKNFTDTVRSLGPREMSSRDLKDAIDKKRQAFERRREQRADEYSRRSAQAAERYASENAQGELSEARLAELERNAREGTDRKTLVLSDRELDIYLVEYHKKFSLPFAALCFVFLAFPAGLPVRKSGGAIGFFIGILVAVAYWCLLFVGQLFGTNFGFSPILSMWMPDLFILAAAVVAFVARRSAS